MLTEEFTLKLAAAEEKLIERAYEDMVRTVHAMEVKPCGNLHTLWMAALNSYNPVTGATNVLTDRHLHALFCRMGIDAPVSVPAPPTPPPAVATFNADFAWVTADPWAAIVAGTDTTVYPITKQIPVGGLMAFDLSSVPINQYLIVRYPDTEAARTNWSNDIFNYGTLPDSVFQAVHTGGGYRYLVTRIQVSLNPVQTLKFS